MRPEHLVFRARSNFADQREGQFDDGQVVALQQREQLVERGVHGPVGGVVPQLERQLQQLFDLGVYLNETSVDLVEHRGPQQHVATRPHIVKVERGVRACTRY